MRFTLLLLLILLMQKAFADQPRWNYKFKSKNGLFELKPSDTIFSDHTIHIDSIYDSATKKYFISNYTIPDRYHWGLYDLSTNQKLYTIRNENILIEAKTANISDDGESIVIVDDFGYGVPSLEVIHFFQRAELIKSLQIKDVLENMCSISLSVSHMRWCSDFYFNDSSQFVINTYSLYQHVYDRKGELLTKTSIPPVIKGDNIVTAQIRRLEKNKYELIIEKSIRGTLLPTQKLILTEGDSKMRRIHGRFHGIFPGKNKIMKQGFYGVLLIRNNTVILNNIRFPSYNERTMCNYFRE
jgi:hypothetical protein